MKIFNTMNTLCAVVAVTAAISMGTTTHAEIIYDGYQAATYGYPGDSTLYETYYFWDDDSEITSEFMSPGVGGATSVMGDQSGMSFQFDNWNPEEWWATDISLTIAFDTATEVSVQTQEYFDASVYYFSTIPNNGIWTVDAGETLEVFISIYSPLSSVGFTIIDLTFNEVPAPGALALLGLAGISTRKQRR